VSEEYEAFAETCDPLAPPLDGQVIEQVALRSGVGHAEVATLPLEPVERGELREELTIGIIDQALVPFSGGDRILAERAHALAIDLEGHGVVVIASDAVLGMFGHPAEALDRVWPVIDDITAERHGVPLGLSPEDRFQGGPVAVNVGKDRGAS
jgi:hypothetical protein